MSDTKSGDDKTLSVSPKKTLTLKPEDPDDALAKFRSNRFAGLLMFLACIVVGTS